MFDKLKNSQLIEEVLDKISDEGLEEKQLKAVVYITIMAYNSGDIQSLSEFIVEYLKGLKHMMEMGKQKVIH
ncbi:MAG TPA: hypothetical protein P5293_05745 [Bacteroidales bacterium]|nr:hypothetical protein [Bacteroidales bacterium]